MALTRAVRLTDTQLLDALDDLRAMNLFLTAAVYGGYQAWTVAPPGEPAEGDIERTARAAIEAACIRHHLPR